ncbi:MAG: UvrD-helicase domain-containing protein, partial [Sphingopyxis sp.]
MPSPTPLDELNAEQRQAVLHGAGDPAGGPPLLVIAGAGSGKTNTLAHRVAHLVAEGADARRILLLTFSRRAATEMTRRVERISGERALPWAGTFHGIGARLLREFAGRVGLDDGFSIHDREDSADLMAMVRHDLGLSQAETRFPAKATCLSIYSRAVNAGEDLEAVLARHFPWCAGWQAELQQLIADYVDAKQRQQVLDYDD